MKVLINIENELAEPYVVIHSNKMTDEIQNIVRRIENSDEVIIGMDNNNIVVLHPEELYMIRVENNKVVIYGKDKSCISKKRLYELEEQLDNQFMRISKSVLINLKYIHYVKPSFNGMMRLVLKNGCKDYISRKYLPNFKKYLGI